MISLMQRATSSLTSLSLCLNKFTSTSDSEHPFNAVTVLGCGDCSTSASKLAACCAQTKQKPEGQEQNSLLANVAPWGALDLITEKQGSHC